MGARGNISVTANVAPAMVAELCQLALAGETQEALALDSKLAPVNAALFLESNPIPVKWALARMGRIGEGLRLPMTALDAQYHSQVEAALIGAGIL